MSEFDKARNLLDRRNIVMRNSLEKNNVEKILFSGESPMQKKFITSYISSRRSSKIILDKSGSTNMWKSYVNDPNTVVIRNSNDSKAYNPFWGHSDVEIYQMLLKLASSEKLTSGFKILLKLFSELLKYDINLIDAVSRSDAGCTLELFERRLDLLVRKNIISEREANARFERLRSYVSSFQDLESLILDLTLFTGNIVSAQGFRTTYSLTTILNQHKNVVFVFDGDLNSASGFDKMLLTLLSGDLEFVESTYHSFDLIINDLSYQYIKPFEWALESEKIPCLVNFESETNYATIQMFGQLVRSNMSKYAIFRHSNSQACKFWSDALGTSPMVEYSYNMSDSNTTKYPLFSPVNNLFGTQQHSESVGYRYVDKNIYQDYDIRNLGPNEFFYYDKGLNQVSQQSIF